MENQELNRYVGDYDKFMEVYEMKKMQLEAAYKKQQKEKHWNCLANALTKRKSRFLAANTTCLNILCQ